MILSLPAFFQKRISLLIVLAALFIFTAGFFFLFGRNASVSGSWKYVINDRDDYLYWAYAKGASEVPASDGQPYYFEDRGKSHQIPYLASLIIGKLAKLFHVGVLTFFPFWYILAPLLTWFALWQCLHWFWKFPKIESSIFAMVFLLGTLFLRTPGFQSIYRFSRPADSLWALLIWLSFVLTSDEKNKGFYLALLASAMVVWFDPFLAAAGLFVSGIEFLWQACVEKNKGRSKLLLKILICVIVSVIGYVAFMKFNPSQNSWVLERFQWEAARVKSSGGNTLGRAGVNMPSLVWLAVVFTFIVLTKTFSKRPFSPLDHLLVSLATLVFLFSNVHMILPGKFQVADHCYHFLLIDLLAVTGWLYEKISLIPKGKFSRQLWGALSALSILTIAIVWSDAITFLRINLAPWASHAILPGHNNTLIHLGIAPVLALLVLLYVQFERARQVLRSAWMLVPLIGSLCYFGFSTSPGNTESYIKNFPFDGAYRWLNRNAIKNEVVLTAPARRAWLDYTILYTDLKIYIHPDGDILSHGQANRDNYFRFLFYFNLLATDLDGIKFENLNTTRAKINRLRLDYVLIERDTPFLPNILRQIISETKPVYQDARCVLLKILK